MDVIVLSLDELTPTGFNTEEATGSITPEAPEGTDMRFEGGVPDIPMPPSTRLKYADSGETDSKMRMIVWSSLNALKVVVAQHMVLKEL